MANTETNPVQTATSNSGQVTALDVSPLYGSGVPNVNTTPTGTTTTFDANQYDPIDPNAGLTDYLSQSGVVNSTGGADTSTTPSAAASGASSNNLLSSLGSLFSGTGVSGLGPYAAVGGLGMYQASQAQSQAQSQASTLSSMGSPYVNAGQQLLQQFQSGQIRPDQQQVVNTAEQQGQTLINSGSTLSAIAQTAYQNYQNGTLPQADELQLQQQAASQKQQIRQQLAQQGITDSSVLAGYDQQIDAQTDITRQSLLNAQFATGNQAYDQWLQSTQAGQQLQLQGEQFASSALDNMLQESLGVGTAGMQPVESAIQLSIQSDQQLSQQVSTLLGNLAAAYAYTVSGPGGKTGGATAGGGTNLVSSLLGKAGNSLLSSSSGADATAAAATASTDAAGIGTGWGGAADTAVNGALGSGSFDTAALTASNDAALAGDLSSLTGGANAASGAAAGSSAASGASGALAAALPFAAAGLATAAPIYGMTQPAVSVGAQYWNGIKSGLQGGNSNPDFYNSAMEVLAMPQNQVPADVQQAVWQSGYVPAGTWGMPNGNISYSTSGLGAGGIGGTRSTGNL